MRRNTKKFKSNPSSSSRHSIRSSSIRDIIGDRRFNGQFSHVNTQRTEGTKKAKRMKVDDAEADDLPNLGQNASSSQCEAANEPRRSCGDFAAKTSEYAFFKKMKETTSCNTNVHPKYHDNQLNNVQQSDHCIREDTTNVQKENIKYAKSSLPVEKQQDDAHYSFFTPVLKNSEINNVLEEKGTNAQQITTDDHNWLSYSVGSKTKTLGNKGVFSMKRDKLRARVADKSSHDFNQLSSKGFDLVSVLMSRILPKDHENNCQDETNSKYKASTLIKSHEANKRKSIESQHTSYFDDDFPKSSERFLEWNRNPNYSDPSFVDHATKSCFQYDQYHSAANKRNMIDSHHISYMDDDFPTSSERLLEWNPDSRESFYVGHAPKTSIQYDSFHSEAYERRWINSRHISWRPKDTDLLEWNPIDSGIRIPEFDEPKLLEQTRPLLLEWEDNREKDEFQTILSTSTLKNNDYNFFMHKTFKSSPPLSPFIDHFVTSSIVPYTPKHTMPLEDSRINEKEESFVFLFQSTDENQKSLMWGPDDLSENRVKSYSFMDDELDDKCFDQIGYPLLLRDSSENETY